MMKPLNDNAHPLESLLQQHCPNGVEFKELGELCEIRTGKLNANAKVENGKYPFFTCDETPYTINTYAFDCEAILISGNGSKVGHIHFYKGKFNAYQRTYILSDFSIITSRFLFFILDTFLKSYILTKCKKASIPYITLPMLENFPIPLPPLEIQQKIVDILDAFTELQAELHARRKQYEYYRNKLLSFEELQRRTDMLNGGGLKLVTLGEIGTFTRGNGLTKSDFVEVGVPCIHYGQIHTHYHNYTHSTTSFVSEEKARKLKKAKCGDLVIAGVSEDKDCVCKAVVYLGKQEACVSGDTFIFSHSQNPKFIGYMFQTENFNTFKHKYAQGAKVLRVHNKHLENFQIPLPPLAVQNEIVELLDKFDTLTNDLTSGIPAEIEARKKQYEHYRERLLSFIAKD
ncbi:restriction endonuclease subunit S [Campylobacter upsaliensis]